MVEMLVRVVDPVLCGDVIVDSKLLRRGDVVHVAPDAAFIGSISGGVLRIEDLMNGQVVPGQIVRLASGTGINPMTHVSEELGSGLFRVHVIVRDAVRTLVESDQVVTSASMTAQWSWGTMERTLTQWRILRLPNVNIDRASVLMAPELDSDPMKPSLVLQARMRGLSLDAGWSEVARNHFTRTRVAQVLQVLEIVDENFSSVIVAKPPLSSLFTID